MKRHNSEELSNVVIRPETACAGRRADFIRSLRPWLFAGVFLLATELFCRLFLPAMLLGDTHAASAATYHEFIQKLGVRNQAAFVKLYVRMIGARDHDAVRVCFLGDSVLLGNDPFKEDGNEPRDDVALSFEREMQRRFPGRRIAVYNISSFGVGEYMAYEMLKALAGFQPDIIIKNVNFRVYNEYPEKKPAGQRPAGGGTSSAQGQTSGRQAEAASGAGLKTPVARRSWNRIMRVPLRELSEMAGTALESFLYEHSTAYICKDYLAFLIFGGPRVEQLEKKASRLQLKPQRFDVPKDGVYHLTPQAIDEMTALVYNFPVLHEKSRSLVFSGKFADLARRMNLPVFYFMSPINRRLVDPLVRDKEAFGKNAHIIASVFEKRGALYRDFSGALDSETAFRDSDHLTHEGNEKLAKLIADAVSSRVADILAGRGGGG